MHKGKQMNRYTGSVFNRTESTYYPPIISRSSKLALPWDHGLLLQRDGQNLKISIPQKDDFGTLHCAFKIKNNHQNVVTQKLISFCFIRNNFKNI